MLQYVKVLIMYCWQIFFRAVNDDDDLRLAKWWIAVGQVFDCAAEIWFVVAWDDDDHPQAGVRFDFEQPGASRFLQVLFVGCSHLASGQSGVWRPLVQWNTTVAGGAGSPSRPGAADGWALMNIIFMGIIIF